MAANSGSGREGFLYACIKNMVDKPKINFEGVAADTGMSVGGANNKYRAIIKQLEAENNGQASAPKTPAASGKASNARSAPTGPKRKAAAVKDDRVKAKIEDGDTTDEEASPAKKPKNVATDDTATKKRAYQPTGRPRGRPKKITAPASPPVDDDDETVDEDEAERKFKAEADEDEVAA